MNKLVMTILGLLMLLSAIAGLVFMGVFLDATIWWVGLLEFLLGIVTIIAIWMLWKLFTGDYTLKYKGEHFSPKVVKRMKAEDEMPELDFSDLQKKWGDEYCDERAAEVSRRKDVWDRDIQLRLAKGNQKKQIMLLIEIDSLVGKLDMLDSEALLKWKKKFEFRLNLFSEFRARLDKSEFATLKPLPELRSALKALQELCKGKTDCLS